ncbi:uncharacterized protein LOC129921637 [Biomphalaria glabrata]|uniref:Uncharacterized protein LOC129921637 n=1 Tax=Biomphalaria glabrata TaxID=6526 RepID=A0A9W2YAI3_BIOGL|nr:uncharacterized protein LOC129921637 [Biomphalaria glabrata]
MVHLKHFSMCNVGYDRQINSPAQSSTNLRTALTKLNHNSKKTVIQWIPAHIQLAGNEKADTLAKSGRTNSQVNSALYPEEMKKLIVDKINEKWTSSHPNHKKDDAYYKLSRQDQRLIFRLRTGHNRMRQHMFRKLKIGTSEICPCGVSPENADHVLQNCSLYQEARLRHWPQITPIERKLYGELPDLETTAQFISCIGLVI